MFERTPLVEVHRQQAAGEPVVREVTIACASGAHPGLAPSGRFEAARGLLVAWHGRKHRLSSRAGHRGRGRDAQSRAARIEDHVRFALLRTKQGASLEKLTWLQRCESVEVEAVTLAVDIKTPKQFAQAEAGKQGDKKSVLEQVADRMSTAPAFGLDDIVRRMADWLGAQRPRSVLLVGPSGVGKTAAAGELARGRTNISCPRIASGRPADRAWWPARPVSAHGKSLSHALRGGRSDQGHCPLRQPGRARAGGPVVQLGGGYRPVLAPYLGRGEVLGIVECTREQLRLVERDTPGMLDVFEQIEVREPPVEEAHDPGGVRPRETATGKGAAEKDRCPRRSPPTRGPPSTGSIGDSPPLGLSRPAAAFPEGRAGRNVPPGQTATADDVVLAFSRETGLPLVFLDDTRRLSWRTCGSGSPRA